MAETATHLDAIVIGSGFGGSVVAARLAEGGMKVCVLERGRRYPPGSFARTQSAMSQNVWDPSNRKLGLFNVWSFAGIEAVVASGLGGGSLIYANVLLRKPREWFAENHGPHREPWPITYRDLESHYEQVERRMDAQQYPFEKKPYNQTLKTAALKEAADRLGLHWELPKLAVTFANKGEEAAVGEVIKEERPNIHERTRLTCLLTGECDVGCNSGSKNTLDYNYLTSAWHAGADIRTLAEARVIAPRREGGYRVSYVQHVENKPYWKTDGREPIEITADRLVLSAGTLGSTYLLLRNQSYFPNLSKRLGDRFCGNGDLLAFASNCRTSDPPPRTRDLASWSGPVITSTIRVSDELDGGTGRGFFIQDAGIPAFATWLLEGTQLKEIVRRLGRTLWRRFRAMMRRDPRSDISGEIASALGECDYSRSWLPLLGMGRDIPDGKFSLRREATGEPLLACNWTMQTSTKYFERVRQTMADITGVLGGRFVPNPTLRLSRVITVHPLGGCPMGVSPENGVVSPQGEVFGYPGFFIADGSVLPGPVGANPSLTIAAVANKTADHILDSRAHS